MTRMSIASTGLCLLLVVACADIDPAGSRSDAMTTAVSTVDQTTATSYRVPGAVPDTDPPLVSAWPDPAQLGECPPDLAPYWDPIDLFAAVAYWGWAEVDSIGEPSSATAILASTTYSPEDFWAVTLTGRVLAGAAALDHPYALRRDVYTIARDELERGARLLVSIDVDGGLGLDFVVSIRPDGDAVFLGECQFVNTREIDQVAAVLAKDYPGATAGSLLETLIVDPTGPAYQAYTRLLDEIQLSWNNLPFDRRSLNPAEAPPDVLSSLETVSVIYDTPDSWGDFDGQLCTLTSLGWNDCVSFGFAGYDVVTRVVPGEDLELWLLGPDADTAQPLADLGTVRYSELEPAIANNELAVHLNIRSDGGITSQEDLVAAARAGTVVLDVRAAPIDG